MKKISGNLIPPANSNEHMNAELLNPDCNLSTVKDGRGLIMAYYPDKPIVEFTYIFLKAGLVRGHHYHPEFDEYLMVMSGTAVETFKDDGKETFFHLGPGDCVRIRAGTIHTLTAITDCTATALLTKRWNDCENPIIQEV
jgi:mannose-6-phosphate isomerase-like protein (cupin superfamily)